MRHLHIVRLVWLLLSLFGLVAAQLMFSGQQSSEVAGNLVFFMLVLCFPASVIGYIAMFSAMYAFEPYGLFAYNSRVVVIAVWSVYFVSGFAQWYLVPFAWNRYKDKKVASKRAIIV